MKSPCWKEAQVSTRERDSAVPGSQPLQSSQQKSQDSRNRTSCALFDFLTCRITRDNNKLLLYAAIGAEWKIRKGDQIVLGGRYARPGGPGRALCGGDIYGEN